MLVSWENSRNFHLAILDNPVGFGIKETENNVKPLFFLMFFVSASCFVACFLEEMGLYNSFLSYSEDGYGDVWTLMIGWSYSNNLSGRKSTISYLHLHLDI